MQPKKLDEIEQQILNAAPQQMEVWLAQLNHQTAIARSRYIESKEVHAIQRDAIEYFVNQQVQSLLESPTKKYSVTGATAKVKSGDDYKERLSGMTDARATMEQHKAESDNLERSWDTIRSILASRNAERRMA